jgi:hypothetical protein
MRDFQRALSLNQSALRKLIDFFFFPRKASQPPRRLMSRRSFVSIPEGIGVAVEAHHHEVATGGQGEIDMRFTALSRRRPAALRCFWCTCITEPLSPNSGLGMNVAVMPRWRATFLQSTGRQCRRPHCLRGDQRPTTMIAV